jgi:hypothetical protein
MYRLYHGGGGGGVGPATQLSITTQPSSTAQAAIALVTQPVIQLRDASNNAVSQAGVVVSLAINSGTAGLVGTGGGSPINATTDASGVATFADVSLFGAAGTQTLIFTSSGLTSVVSGNIALVAGTLRALSITTQPSATATSGTQLATQPVVQLCDVCANPISQASVVITAVVSGVGTLSGTVTATTNSSGVATFTNLTLTTASTDTLTFTATGLMPITSDPIVVGAGGSIVDTLYLMSNETPGANTVLIDDQRRGNYYLVDADHTSWSTVAPGYAGDIFTTDAVTHRPFPNGAVVNLAAISKNPVFATSDFAETSGVIMSTVQNMASHNLSGADTGGYSEVYVRFYCRFVEAEFYGTNNPPASFLFGASKWLDFNRYGDDAGIWWAALGFNIASEASSTGTLGATSNHGTDTIYSQNQGNNISLAPGKWYFVEVRIKLNTSGNSDGIYQLWVNDGGTTGDFTSQTPTLRASHTGLDFGYGAGGGTTKIGNLWWENWSNASSVGETMRKNMRCDTSGPIGFLP